VSNFLGGLEGPQAGKQISLKPGDDDFCFQLKGFLPKIAFDFFLRNQKVRFLAAEGGLVGERGSIKQGGVLSDMVTT
jgi:hypothetical protein